MAEAFVGLDKVASDSGKPEKKKKDKDKDKDKNRSPDPEANKELAKDMIKETKKESKESAKPESGMSEEEVLDEKMRLIKSIQKYNSARFGAYLKETGINFNEEHLRKQDIDGLKWILRKCDSNLGTKHNSNMIDHLIKNGLELIEGKIHESTKFKIRGTVGKSFKDEIFMDNYERIKLKYGLTDIIGTDPLMVCSFSLFNTAMMMHNINSLKTDTDLNRPVDISDLDNDKPGSSEESEIINLDGPQQAPILPQQRENNLE